MLNYDEIKKQISKYEVYLKPYACLSKDAIRFKDEESDIRSAFARDCDRIIHTLSYTRYSDKTQVYSDINNDNISKRMTHVQFVSRASRTIAKALGTNEELCEAISLGHDVGHTPMGHIGERILNEISNRELGISFAHNLNSVRVFMNVEDNGQGLNLTLQVLDGIMCHNGEMVKSKYTPISKTKEEFLKEYNSCILNENQISCLRPMTLEGCIVRISDIIGYIGKDIEDAILMNTIKVSDIPKNIVDVLGCNNKCIMNSIILDIIEQSFSKPYIQLSDKIYDAIVDLKDFNMKNIYLKANTNEAIKQYKKMFNTLFNVYLKALKSKDKDNDINKIFLLNMNVDYFKSSSNEQIVIDYIAGMTDRFLQRQYLKYK
ncbi:MAG: HD domain-containing protein [Clostridia bacterium]